MNPGRKKKVLKEFGITLKKLRDERGFSLRELAAETEIEHAHISRMEDGLVNPTMTTLVILAEALQVAPAALMPG